MGNDLYFKLIAIGEHEVEVNEDVYMAITYKYCEDEECETGSQKNKAYFSSNSLPDFWTIFHLGDEAVVVLDSNCDDVWHEILDLKNKKVHWPLISRFKIMALYEDFEYSGSPLLIQNLLTYREENEIENMLSNIKGEWEQKNGCFISIQKEGKGDTVKVNKEVILNYQAYFSNGYKFDDTERWHDSLKIAYGFPDQIIEGLQIGIEGLQEGTEAKIIIPSQLAFGKAGSSSGIVPPFEPLLYQIKITSVTSQDL